MMAVSHLKPLLFKWRYLVGWSVCCVKCPIQSIPICWMCTQFFHPAHAFTGCESNVPSSQPIHLICIKCPIHLMHSLTGCKSNVTFFLSIHWMWIKCPIWLTHSLDVYQMSHPVHPFTPCVLGPIMLIFCCFHNTISKKHHVANGHLQSHQTKSRLPVENAFSFAKFGWGNLALLTGGHPFWGLKFSTCQQHPNAVTITKVKWVPKNQITKFGALVNQSNTMTLNNTSHHNKILFLKKYNILCSWLVSQLSRDLQPKTFTPLDIVSFYSRSC
jgi:hypothetical protein